MNFKNPWISKLSDAICNKRYLTGSENTRKRIRNLLIDQTIPFLVNFWVEWQMFSSSGKCMSTVIFGETWRWVFLK